MQASHHSPHSAVYPVSSTKDSVLAVYRYYQKHLYFEEVLDALVHTYTVFFKKDPCDSRVRKGAQPLSTQ